MKKLFFGLCSIIIFSGIVMAQSPSVDDCKQFKAIVVIPPDDIDKKFEAKPSDQVEAKGIVVNPCKLLNMQVLDKSKAPTVKNFLLNSNPSKLSTPATISSLKQLPQIKFPVAYANKPLIKKNIGNTVK